MTEQYQPLSLTLTSPEDVATEETVFEGAEETDAWLKLEQEEDYVGYPMTNSPCLHARLVVGVRVYRSDRELEYTLELSHGTLSDAPEAIEEEVERSSFMNLATSLDLTDEGCLDLLWARWEGTVRDAQGNPVANPPTFGQPGQASSGPGALGRPTVPQLSGMSFANGVLQWPMALHGTLRYRFLTGYDRWEVTLTPRDGTNQFKPENYESTLSAFFAGRAENLELDVDFDCSGTPGSDDEEEEQEGCVDHIIEVYGCNGDPTGEEWDEVVPCTDSGGDGSEETA
ncbi:MAG: hypothetical protein KQH59_18170 [Desulfobulbaceae bacterium]|nr:hypothetical protein [Desulfobulbaceae bacterium]